MENGRHFLFNSLDKILFIIISSFLINGYLLWFISNVLRLNDLYLWFLTIPVSISISYFTSKRFYFHPVELNLKILAPYIVLFCLLIVSTLYLLEPAFVNPNATIGIPNKDLHDGIAAFISTNGFPPSDQINGSNAFIPGSQNGLYLGYPSGLHVVTGFLDKLGVSIFDSSWIVVVIALLITSLSVFLISKIISNNVYYSATIAGLFALSSYRLSLGVVASIPMLFSYALVIPCLLICLVTVHNSKDKYAYFISAFAIAFLAASYSGTIVAVGGLLVFYALFLFLTKDKESLSNLGKLIVISLPLLFLTLPLQHHIYWQNTFPTSIDYDPFELSQRLAPLDKPIYMLFYAISMVVAFIYLIKNRGKSGSNYLKLFLFLINLGFLALIPYEFLFRQLNHITASSQLANVVRDGFFGGLNYQKISRLALLQPFFFIFFVGEFSNLIKNKTLQVIALILVFSLFLFVRVDLSLYQWIAPEVGDSLYNQTSLNKPITLLSDIRLVQNNQIWSKDIISGLDYLKSVENRNDKVLVWDDRIWTEETITGWGSDYVGYRLLRRSDSNQAFSQRQLGYILLLYPSQTSLEILKNTLGASQVWNKNNTYIFKLQ